MKYLWLASYVIEALLFVIGVIMGGLSFVIGVIAWAVTQHHSNCVTQFCDPILGVVADYITPVFMFLFLINGLHALSTLSSK